MFVASSFITTSSIRQQAVLSVVVQLQLPGKHQWETSVPGLLKQSLGMVINHGEPRLLVKAFCMLVIVVVIVHLVFCLPFHALPQVFRSASITYKALAALPKACTSGL